MLCVAATSRYLKIAAHLPATVSANTNLKIKTMVMHDTQDRTGRVFHALADTDADSPDS